MNRQQLGEILVGQKLITRDQLKEALDFQLHNPLPLGQILIQRGLVSDGMILRALAAQMGVSPWDPSTEDPEPGMRDILSQDVCRRHMVAPIRWQGDLLKVAMVQPLDVETLDLVRNLAGARRVEPLFALRDHLLRLLDRWDGRGLVIDDSRLDSWVAEALKDSRLQRPKKRVNAQLSEIDTRPVISVVNQILTSAIRMGSSDVHIEPGRDTIQVRFRIDGQLRKVLEFPMDIMPMLSVRLKIMADLDIVEWRVPQDGRITAAVDGRDVDLRVSIIPNYRGPRFVLRILERTAAARDLPELGMTEQNLNLFLRMIHRPHGLVLVTGPTGSGKTTTLYSALQEIRTTTNNILTCEDPVEYEVEGVGQSHVNEKIGLTFAGLLRAALRQDPDVILVGEIRDKETAETAIRAALTGHLVLSTLHCNDAPNAIPRLIDMGVDPYLLSTCLVGVTAQRLLRRLDPDRREIDSDSLHLPWVASALRGYESATFYRPKETVRGTGEGYRGRLAVHEVMPVSSKVAHAIAHHEAIDRVKELATLAGYRPMVQDAVAKAAAGQTSLEEIQRVLVLSDFEDIVSEPTLKLAA